MTDNHNQKKQDAKKGGLNPIVAAVTGVIVGASIVTALRDKKNREKVKQTLTNVRDQAVGYIEKIQKEVKKKKKVINSTKNFILPKKSTVKKVEIKE